MTITPPPYPCIPSHTCWLPPPSQLVPFHFYVTQTCKCACVYMHACVCMSALCTCACLCVCMHTYLCECVCACLYVCMHAWVCACVCACVSACVCVCMYVRSCTDIQNCLCVLMLQWPHHIQETVFQKSPSHLPTLTVFLLWHSLVLEGFDTSNLCPKHPT